MFEKVKVIECLILGIICFVVCLAMSIFIGEYAAPVWSFDRILSFSAGVGIGNAIGRFVILSFTSSKKG